MWTAEYSNDKVVLSSSTGERITIPAEAAINIDPDRLHDAAVSHLEQKCAEMGLEDVAIMGNGERLNTMEGYANDETYIVIDIHTPKYTVQTSIVSDENSDETFTFDTFEERDEAVETFISTLKS